MSVLRGLDSRQGAFARLARWAVLAACVGCGGGEATFTKQLAPNFVPGRETVSVFGVFKDGQMSSGAWDGVESRFSTALNSSRCEAGYTDTLSTVHAEVSAAIEDYARADGPTDDLLGKIAPAARGSLILVLTFSGRLPVRGSESKEPPASLGGGPSGGPPRRRGGGQGGPPPGGFAAPITDELDLSASLYSVQRSQSVAVVSLRYLGASADEAVAQLAAKLKETIPASTCTGWNWDASIDAEAIRHSIDP